MPKSQTNNALLWQKLKAAAFEDRLGHALLLRFYPDSASSEEFYRSLYDFCGYLHCDNKKSSDKNCGHCDSCAAYVHFKTFDDLLHPDLYIMAPENAGTSYSVDQIRALSGQFSLRRALSPKRIAVLRDAEYLSWSQTAPANALLKLLEEPRPDSLLILTSTRGEGILKTLQSRCQSFKLLPGEGADQSVDSGEWKSFLGWVANGLPSNDPAMNPADQESFWKERGDAFAELSQIFVLAFDGLKKNVGRLSLLEARRSLDFLNLWQEMLQQSRFHIQGHLHWLEIQKSLRKAG